MRLFEILRKSLIFAIPFTGQMFGSEHAKTWSPLPTHKTAAPSTSLEHPCPLPRDDSDSPEVWPINEDLLEQSFCGWSLNFWELEVTASHWVSAQSPGNILATDGLGGCSYSRESGMSRPPYDLRERNYFLQMLSPVHSSSSSGKWWANRWVLAVEKHRAEPAMFEKLHVQSMRN